MEDKLIQIKAIVRTDLSNDEVKVLVENKIKELEILRNIIKLEVS